MTDYLAMLRRHWWLIALGLVVGLAAGAGYNHVLPREYVSTASVLVRPAGQDANVSGGRTRDEINLDTEAQLLRSTAVVDGAAKLLQQTDSDDLAAAVTVEVPPNTSVLQIKFSAETATAAQKGASAFAKSYLDNRDANAKSILASQVDALRAKLVDLNADLTKINNSLVGAKQGSSVYATLDSQRDTTLGQINQLTNKINQINMDTVSGGVIIREARVPGRPIKPRTPINLAAGMLLGLMLGVGASATREKLDKRVRAGADLVKRDVNVLGEVRDKTLTRSGTRDWEVLAPFSPGGRAFNRLRNEVVAALRPGEQVVVVTGASKGPAATLVAANLAAALARTGTNVVLVGANGPESLLDAAPLARLLGVSPTPGLSDVLAGKANLAEATQRAARNPTLRVITAGGTGSAAGLLQSQGLKDMIATLRTNAEYLVIEAPSTSAGADAQSLASLADAAILAVELKRTRRPEVVDAHEQLRRVGTPLLGAVVLPRLGQQTFTLDEPELEVALVETEHVELNGHEVEPEREDQTVMMSTLDEEALATLDEVNGSSAK